jgi:Putative transposase
MGGLCQEPFAGPQAVLAYLSRYTHCVAISNRRLISANKTGVTFNWKDYRIEGPDRYKTVTLPTHEFIRRFLTHVLPKGLHRIRHYGLFANGNRAADIARARELLAVPSCAKRAETFTTAAADEPRVLPRPCRCGGGRMIIVETFAGGCQPKRSPAPATAAIRIDTSRCRHRRSTRPVTLAILVALGRQSPTYCRSINRPAVAPPTLSCSARSARSARHPRPSFEAKAIGAGLRSNLAQHDVAAKSP